MNIPEFQHLNLQVAAIRDELEDFKILFHCTNLNHHKSSGEWQMSPQVSYKR